MSDLSNTQFFQRLKHDLQNVSGRNLRSRFYLKELCIAERKGI